MDDHNYAKSGKLKSYKMCCVPGCLNYKSGFISLHAIPKKLRFRKQWIHKCRIGKKITSTLTVCSAHFLQSDYKNGENVRRKHLWSFAVPSLNLPPSSTSFGRQRPNQDRQQRAKDRYSRTLVNAAKIVNEGETIKFHAECSICAGEDSQDNSQPASTSDTSKGPLKDASIQVNTIEDFDPTTGILDVITSNKKLNSWTGIPTFAILEAIVDSVLRILKEDGSKAAKHKLYILLVFVKLKSNMKFVYLSPIFKLSESTLSRNFKKYVPIIRAGMNPCIYFAKKEEIRCNLPNSFKEDFVNVRSILDCTEIPIEIPKCVNCKIATYSHYKGKNTVKFLVSITPAGLISFVSDAYGGKASDKFIFNSENLISKFEENVDAIMVDKGFAILHETKMHGITLIRPTFSNGGQFEESDVIESTKVAASRVHVERAIQRIKMFSILQNTVDHNMLPYISDIFFIISAITNLTTPILAEDKF